MKADIKASSKDDLGTPCFSDKATVREADMVNQARQSFCDEAGRKLRTSSNEPGAAGIQQPGPRSPKDSADALLDVIDELFDAYETDADDWRAESIEFSLPALMDDVVKMFTERAQNKGLQLSLDISASLPSLVRGDRDRLRQILINLLANAVKISERGTIVVRSALAEETCRRALIRFSIEHIGIGIAHEHSKRSIGSLAARNSPAGPGNLEHGFGLIACRRLIEHLGGTMQVESEFGHGSTVSFSIVLDKADRFDRSPDIARAATEPTAETASHDTIHVESLLDRCYGDANFCSLMLRKFSHRAGNQLAALDRAARNGNALELAREAHTLKGLAGNLSATPLQISADRLEQVARQSELKDAGSLLDQVRDQVARCVAEIPRVLAQISRSE